MKPTKKELQTAENDKRLEQFLKALKAVEEFKAKQKQ